MTNITPKEVAELLHNAEVDEGYTGTIALQARAGAMAALIIKQDAENKRLRGVIDIVLQNATFQPLIDTIKQALTKGEKNE
jgi:hypothetical protein